MTVITNHLLNRFHDYVGQCPELSPLAYGEVALTDQRLIGDNATYACSSGFELDLTNGSEVRTCQADGMWSGYPPTCVRKLQFL